MTFTEAAAHVLRLVGKPLHYKEITDVAIEKNLLSHVGKSPEVTMGARLAAVVKKTESETPLVRVKPGVFALRDWEQSDIDKGLADRTPALEYLAAREANGEVGSEPANEEAPLASSPVAVSEADAPQEADEIARAELAATASEFFEPEEDDDEPIFGAAEEEGGSDDDRDDDNGRGKRRRRRRSRTTRESGGDLPGYTVSDAPAELDPEVEAKVREKEREQDDDDSDDAEPEEREERESRGRRRRGRDRDRDRDRDRGDRDRGDRDKVPSNLDDLAGPELADAVADMLRNQDRRGNPVSLKQLADAAHKKGKFCSDVGQAQSVLVAVMRADNLRREGRQERLRFRFSNNKVALTDCQLDNELSRLESDIASKVERYRELSRKALLRRIQDLPQRAVAELIMVLLEALGFGEVRSVKRPGSHGGELHISARSSLVSGGIPTAIVVRRDGREIGRERVTELRGALHHYGPAAAGWLITTGQVLSGAREEAGVATAAPVCLVDGAALADLCERYGIGMAKTTLSLCVPDPDLFDALKNG